MSLDNRSTQGLGALTTHRSAAQVRELQLIVTSVVMDAPTLLGNEQAETADVLAALGLLQKTEIPGARGFRRVGDNLRVCGVDSGTLRGYRRHISAYGKPCNPCLNARTAELFERWQKLGIDQPDIINLAI